MDFVCWDTNQSNILTWKRANFFLFFSKKPKMPKGKSHRKKVYSGITYKRVSQNSMSTRVAKAKKAGCARSSKSITVKDGKGSRKSFKLVSKNGSKCRWHDASKKHGAPRKHFCPSGQKYNYVKGRCATPGPRGAPRVCPVGQRNLCVKRACGVPRDGPGRPARCPSGQRYNYVKGRCQKIGYRSPGSRQSARAATAISSAFKGMKARDSARAQKAAAVAIQKMARSKSARASAKLVKAVKKTATAAANQGKSATAIQSAIRQKVAKKAAASKKAAIVKLQSAIRAKSSKRRASAIRAAATAAAEANAAAKVASTVRVSGRKNKGKGPSKLISQI